MRVALEREERRDESGGRKREPGDRWPFQTMRNSGDKGGARARMRGEKMMAGESVERERTERDRENGRKGGEKIVAETTFSTKGRGGDVMNDGGKADGEREGKSGQRERGKERERKEQWEAG